MVTTQYILLLQQIIIVEIIRPMIKLRTDVSSIFFMLESIAYKISYLKMVFMSIALTDFDYNIGSFVIPSQALVINLKLKIYTLLLGKYIYTHPEKVRWDNL